MMMSSPMYLQTAILWLSLSVFTDVTDKTKLRHECAVTDNDANWTAFIACVGTAHTQMY